MRSQASGVAAMRLHNREGGTADDLKKTYDVSNAPGLGALLGKSPQGTWTLVVEDKAQLDTGRTRGLTLELRF